MDKLRRFLETDNGRLAAIAAGACFLLLVLWVITPKTQNIIINSASDCVISAKNAKKINKRRKDKKNKVK